MADFFFRQMWFFYSEKWWHPILAYKLATYPFFPKSRITLFLFLLLLLLLSPSPELRSQFFSFPVACCCCCHCVNRPLSFFPTSSLRLQMRKINSCSTGFFFTPSVRREVKEPSELLLLFLFLLFLNDVQRLHFLFSLPSHYHGCLSLIEFKWPTTQITTLQQALAYFLKTLNVTILEANFFGTYYKKPTLKPWLSTPCNISHCTILFSTLCYY